MKRILPDFIITLVVLLTAISAVFMTADASPDLSMSEIEALVVDYFLDTSGLDGNFVIFSDETITTDDKYIFFVRFQGNGYANSLYALVSVKTDTGEMFVDDDDNYVCNLWSDFDEAADPAVPSANLPEKGEFQLTEAQIEVLTDCSLRLQECNEEDIASPSFVYSFIFNYYTGKGDTQKQYDDGVLSRIDWDEDIVKSDYELLFGTAMPDVVLTNPESAVVYRNGVYAVSQGDFGEIQYSFLELIDNGSVYSAIFDARGGEVVYGKKIIDIVPYDNANGFIIKSVVERPDFESIPAGDFSNYAGVYEFPSGHSYVLLPNGLTNLDVDHDDTHFTVKNIRDNDDGSFSWDVATDFDGAMHILWPVGVEATDHFGYTVETDTSRVRMWRGNGDVTLDSISYKRDNSIVYKPADDTAPDLGGKSRPVNKPESKASALNEAPSVYFNGTPVHGDTVSVAEGVIRFSWNFDGELKSYYIYVKDPDGNILLEGEDVMHSAFEVHSSRLIPGGVYTLTVGALPLNGTDEDIVWRNVLFTRPAE